MRKICTKCKVEKDYSEFPKSAKGRKGVRAECIACTRNRAKKRHADNREKCNLKSKEWRDSNPEKVKKGMKLWRDKHKEETKEYNKFYRETFPEKAKAAQKSWEERNPEKVKASREREKVSLARKIRTVKNAGKNKESLLQWRIDNPEKYCQQIKRANDKRSGILKYKISGNISSRIREKLIKGSKAEQHWESLVDFTIDQLRQHLEKLFTPEMSWDNYGTYWHIDHKAPIAAFNFERPEDVDFRICWSIKNLQPLEAIKNKKKSAKVDEEFLQQLRASM